ncbi:MAG TPA: magnesium transporter [Terriglobia bacterium]|nr:magnesium transporter [Terriglobia bacterium]
MSSAAPPLAPNRQVRVVLSTTALLSFMSVSRATALALAELGIAAFFVIGVARSIIGESAPWFVLVACALSAFVRAIDIESWAFFIPGGLIGRTERVFGSRVANVATAAVLTERLLLVALACALCGQYAVSFGATWMAKWSVTARLTIQELVTVGAIILIGLLWTRTRIGLQFPPTAVAKAVWVSVFLIFAVILLGVATIVRQRIPAIELALAPLQSGAVNVPFFREVLTLLTGFALVLPALGGGGTLARAANEFAPPRLEAVRRTSFFIVVLVFVLTVFSSFLFLVLVPGDQATLWANAPLSGLAHYLDLPAVANGLVIILVLLAAFLMLVPSAHAALEDSEQLLRRLSAQGTLTAAGPINMAAAAAVLITFASGAQVSWLSRAYGISIAATLLLKIAAILRLRSARCETQPFATPINLRVGSRQVPVGLIAVGAVVSLSALTMVLRGDIPSIAAISLIGGLGLSMAGRKRDGSSVEDEEEPFALSTSPDVSLGQVQVRPGNVLVGIRHADSLAHVVAALQDAGDRDVVILTIRLLGADEESVERTGSTRDERYLFSQVVALTERYGRPVRLLIVPARNVFDGTLAVALRLNSSEVYVGESRTLSADEQARLLGEAWEQAEKPKNQQLRLVVYRNSGRTDSYHLGAHPPALTPGDLDLIHRVWLDAVKAVGPEVHHHDVVRAALTQMEHQLTGSQREEVLGIIRDVARPADELAATIQARNYTRLRDLVRNRHANDLAAVLTQLGLEDEVIVFRILPRKEAAAVFQYLSHEQQEMLLKAMAQEDVAALLNNMAPDDRTMFLEELPAEVTRQMLALLTPAERSVALTLLGYPEDSIGRLMTPHYIGVREAWTVREVLDYIRVHGRNSETLNVVYVVDEEGQLIDDVRIREFLLTSLDSRVTDLMDRHFVALKATDDQQTAVAVFRQYDRTALPVTDTAGMLIGIVTIDDVLDVAEATATKEIQRIGGSEALDEPYMEISFSRMIRKRAGWLTALFLGEMLTATAMGVFEGEIAKAVVLALFVPLIISSGGNSGSQAATLVIRALALGEVALADLWRVVRREVMAGLALGGILGGIGFLRISIWSAFSDLYGPHWLLVAITVGLALIGIVLWGTLVGSVLPFILRRLGFDPAASSAPFVATLVDVTGLVIYFSVAMIILRGTLLK